MTIVSAPSETLLPAGEWSVDAGRSRVGFAVRKLGFGTVHGRFHDFAAAISVRDGGTLAGGAVRVSSIDTGDDVRDGHLLADGFFAASAHPEMVYRARRIEPLGRHWRIEGELTIRGVTRTVELAVDILPASGEGRRRLHGRGELDRRDFGLTWSRAIEATGAVSASVTVELELELVHAQWTGPGA